MITIYPYKLSGNAYVMSGENGITIPGIDVWVFDDETTGLYQEALISGTDEVIDFMTSHIPNASDGFKLTFSNEPLDGQQIIGYWYKEGYADGDWGRDILGNWYLWNLPFQNYPSIAGWLCPALFLYFDTAPQRLYVIVEPK